MANLLIEIGVEELPLDSLDVVLADLSPKFQKALQEARLDFQEVKVEATPRRIALFVSELAARQRDEVLEFSGPSKQAAYDVEGKPTQALQGFLRSKGATLEDVSMKETPKGSFILVRKKEIGKPAVKVIAGILTSVLGSIVFPKMMRWECSGFRFPRPIRWFVLLLDRAVIPAQLADVRTGRISRGHRFLAPQTFTIPSADWAIYKKLLKKHHVTLELSDREAQIRKGLETQFGLKKIDADLLRLNAQLVEEPFLISGGFAKEYLDLPTEVLTTVMKKNQKIFACYDAKGKAVNRFAAVLNGKRKGLPRIQSDFESVLESRLKDARYFYAEDTKHTLESRVEQLAQIIYLGKLGTLKDKASRMEKIAVFFAKLAEEETAASDLARAASLSKTDLLTKLVYEMPDLQGIVGGEYARRSGEKDAVADAIRTQYLPKNLSEDAESVALQVSKLGAMLGILDRLDLLVGAFGIGMEPTGSQDPFALRRAAGVVVKLIRAYRIRFSMPEVLQKIGTLYGQALKISSDEWSRKLSSFLQDRIFFDLGLQPGTRGYEILKAVLKASSSDVADVFDRFEALSHLEKNESELFYSAVKAVERPANILKGMKSDPGEVKAEALTEEIEKQLYQLLQSKGDEVCTAVRAGCYAEATRLLGKHFAQPIHDFFSKVLVNAEDAEIRRNRQALMKWMVSIYGGTVADLSLLTKAE